MKLETNTIGNRNHPQENDIYEAFGDEWADVAGNLYGLSSSDGFSLHAISGQNLQGYSLSYRQNKNGWGCPQSFTRDEVRDYFLRFLKGDRTWLTELQWQKPKRSFLAIILVIFVLALFIVVWGWQILKLFTG